MLICFDQSACRARTALALSSVKQISPPLPFGASGLTAFS